MAYAQVAAGAARAATAYGPRVLALAQENLKKVTGGKVSNVSELAQYVSASPQRLKVTTEALVRAGVPVDDILPEDITGGNNVLTQVRASAMKIVGTMQGRYQAGSDTSLQTGDAVGDIARDKLRKKRVKTALRIFGSAQAYFLTNPNGGIPVDDFTWYQQVILED